MKEKIPVKIKKLDPRAIIPRYQSKGASGFDFHALIDNDLEYIIVEPKDQAIVRTGLSISIPEGYEIQVRPRSGLSFKFKITITNSPGTVDSDFCIPNEIKIIIYNLSDKKFSIKQGDRIAQGILAEVFQADFFEVENIDKEDNKRNRGGGFGSTGLK